MWRMGPQPHPEVRLPVQRELGVTHRQARAGDRAVERSCSWIVLVAEVDERRLVQVGRHARETSVEGVGSSHPASCSGGEGASEAGSRRQSRENGGGLASIPEGGASRPAGEWALVEGRRPGSEEAVVFDEKAAEAGLVAPPGRFGRKAEEAGRGCDRGRQRLRRKLGTRLRTPRPGDAARRSTSIEAPPGPRSVRPSGRLGPRPQTRSVGTL
jgi:hypothetical protein